MPERREVLVRVWLGALSGGQKRMVNRQRAGKVSYLRTSLPTPRRLRVERSALVGQDAVVVFSAPQPKTPRPLIANRATELFAHLTRRHY